MKLFTRLLFSGVTGLSLFSAGSTKAQAPNVPISEDRDGADPALAKAASALHEAKVLLSLAQVQAQMGRTSCELKLPQPNTQPLAGREIWKRARESYVRVGWHYLCRKCDKWHLNLAAGCFITADGAVLTAYHVAQPEHTAREGYLIAATEAGQVLPVTEVLAGNKQADTCILRVRLDAPVKPLPLNANIYPGDAAWCYSAPLDHPGYFTMGLVNRFIKVRKKNLASTRMDVSTDWAPGSSGAAVLDECGNVIGCVSEIEVEMRPASARGRTNQANRGAEPLITFHHASRAAEALALVKPEPQP